MKIKIKKIIILVSLTLFLINIFKYNNIVTISTIKAIELWIKKIFPSLFIMFIINDLIINTNSYLIFVKLLKLKSNKSIAFILSIFSGSPANAFIIKELFEQKKISLNDANNLLMCSYFSNPLFLYNILNLMFPKVIVLKLICIHYLSNIIIYITTIKRISNKLEIKSTNYNIFLLLEKSIKKSINTLFMILGTITFFMIISNLLINMLHPNELSQIIIKGLFEITQSLNDLINYSSSTRLKEILALSIITFGGFSIHMQIFSIISNTKIKYIYFLKGRIIGLLISITLLIITINI